MVIYVSGRDNQVWHTFGERTRTYFKRYEKCLNYNLVDRYIILSDWRPSG